MRGEVRCRRLCARHWAPWECGGCLCSWEAQGAGHDGHSAVVLQATADERWPCRRPSWAGHGWWEETALGIDPEPGKRMWEAPPQVAQALGHTEDPAVLAGGRASSPKEVLVARRVPNQGKASGPGRRTSGDERAREFMLKPDQ